MYNLDFPENASAWLYVLNQQQANIWDAIQNIISVVCPVHLNLVVQENMH